MINEYGDQLPVLLIYLLKGVMHQEDDIKRWQNLLDFQGPVQDYLAVIGLELVLFEDEGFAYLRNRERTEEEAERPQLIVRRPLSYSVSLLLAQLRRKMAEHDASSGEERLIINKQEIVDLMGTFYTSGSNEVQFTRKIGSVLQKVADLGFIRFIGEKKDKIEVKRILKAFVDAQWLQEFDLRLKEYIEYGRTNQNKREIADE
ncbi:MAG: DUF4194 domain-containing protein [Spirochaetia bacterium]|jgi:chromosome condensin MukBEF MukE localization factor|nr:DUF4194 domain-containing protein [Spirochaetia bacterium]